jgi:hypothetical protein
VRERRLRSPGSSRLFGESPSPKEVGYQAITQMISIEPSGTLNFPVFSESATLAAFLKGHHIEARKKNGHLVYLVPEESNLSQID